MKIVVKVGTGVLTDEAGRLDGASMLHLVSALAQLNIAGHQVILVSSGAVGAGVSMMGLNSYPQELAMKQACAAVGQPSLMRQYENLFDHFRIRVAQLLLTADDFRKRSHYVLATLSALSQQDKLIPIINENDTVSVDELRFGDNDMLSVCVAELVGADRLFLMTSVDGLYADLNQRDVIISQVDDVDVVLQFAGDVQGKFSMGGMSAKLSAVSRAVESGIGTYIANGRKPACLLELLEGQGVGTYFTPKAKIQ